MKTLRALARSYGVLWRYYDVDGHQVEAEPDVLLAVLRTLGSSIRSLDDVDEALAERRQAIRERLAPVVVVLWEDVPPFVAVRLDDASAEAIDCLVTLEDGECISLRFEPDRLFRLGARVRLPLPELPPGYHRLSLRAGSRSSESYVIAAPRRSYRAPIERKRSGLFAPLYALRTKDTAFSGDFTDLGRLVDLTAKHGGDFVATLPFLSARPGEASPYSPLSRLFWNELYADPRRTPEWAAAGEPWPSDSPDPLIDYDAMARWKRALLSKLTAEARRSRPEAFEHFVSRVPLAEDYARFRAGSSQAIDEHLYGQLVAERQLAELSDHARQSGVGLLFDLPLGTDPAGFDAELERETFARGVEVGAPPDAVFRHGQRWGFAPLLPDESRASGYRYWIQSLRHSMRYADMLRIDHVMGLHRQFWIPNGFEVRQGVYVRYPHEELYAVLTLESHRARCEVVGENLGMVPPAVDLSLLRHGVRGIYVLQYSLTGEERAPVLPVPTNCLASLNTHDTPPFAGFFDGFDVSERRDLGLVSAEGAERERAARREAIRAFHDSDDRVEQLLYWLRFLKESPAELVGISLEDLWLETESQNLPGTSGEMPNWRRRLRHRLDELPLEVLSRLEILRPD